MINLRGRRYLKIATKYETISLLFGVVSKPFIYCFSL